MHARRITCTKGVSANVGPPVDGNCNPLLGVRGHARSRVLAPPAAVTAALVDDQPADVQLVDMELADNETLNGKPTDCKHTDGERADRD
ncbi:MAG: hypothetical protein QOI11_83 [Candidatus Eremiobacteraeota bacterium]|nr:hypothetical protein [Candidatus Eremiobacteraeota bacterium]